MKKFSLPKIRVYSSTLAIHSLGRVDLCCRTISMLFLRKPICGIVLRKTVFFFVFVKYLSDVVLSNNIRNKLLPILAAFSAIPLTKLRKKRTK